MPSTAWIWPKSLRRATASTAGGGVAGGGVAGGRAGARIIECLLGSCRLRGAVEKQIHIGLDVVDCGMNADVGQLVEDGRSQDDQQKDWPEQTLDQQGRIDRAEVALLDLQGEPGEHHRSALADDLGHDYAGQLRVL